MKIRPMGAELRTDGRKKGRTDRQTDMTKLIVTFRSYANAPKMAIKSDVIYGVYFTFVIRHCFLAVTWGNTEKDSEVSRTMISIRKVTRKYFFSHSR